MQYVDYNNLQVFVRTVFNPELEQFSDERSKIVRKVLVQLLMYLEYTYSNAKYIYLDHSSAEIALRVVEERVIPQLYTSGCFSAKEMYQWCENHLIPRLSEYFESVDKRLRLYRGQGFIASKDLYLRIRDKLQIYETTLVFYYLLHPEIIQYTASAADNFKYLYRYFILSTDADMFYHDVRIRNHFTIIASLLTDPSISIEDAINFTANERDASLQLAFALRHEPRVVKKLFDHMCHSVRIWMASTLVIQPSRIAPSNSEFAAYLKKIRNAEVLTL